MNTPPPEPATNGIAASCNGNGNSNGNRSASRAATAQVAARALLDTSDEEMIAHTPPPQSTKSSLPPRDAVHCACAHDGEGRLALMLRTIDFAAWKHQCQRRKDLDQTPYINHPVAVANILSSSGVTDIHVLQAAILHDTVEDTHTTIGKCIPKEIERTFGPKVASIVGECTDDVSLSGPQRKTEQLRTAPLKSQEAQQVKLADKLHNLESIRRSPPVGWGVRRVQAYFVWAKQVTDACAPANPELASRLQKLYETAYTRVSGEYFPCHPEICGPLTEEEKGRVDSRFASCKAGDEPCPRPLFF